MVWALNFQWREIILDCNVIFIICVCVCLRGQNQVVIEIVFPWQSCEVKPIQQHRLKARYYHPTAVADLANVLMAEREQIFGHVTYFRTDSDTFAKRLNLSVLTWSKWWTIKPNLACRGRQKQALIVDFAEEITTVTGRLRQLTLKASREPL